MKALDLTILSEEPHKEICQNGCHLKNTHCINLIIHVHILGIYLYISARYKVSMVKPVARMTIHR